MMSYSSLPFLVAFTSIGISITSAEALAEGSTSVVVGQCNIVSQNIQLAEGATYSPYVDCSPGDGKPGYRVRYVWLNSTQISFLFSNYVDNTLSRLVTRTPKIVKNEVYEQIDKLMDIASVRPSANSDTILLPFYTKLVAPDGKTASNESKAAHLNDNVVARLRLYAGDDPIIWFDVEAAKSIKHTTAWPSTYKFAYGKGTYENTSKTNSYTNVSLNPTDIGGLRLSQSQDVGQLMSCLVLHRFVTQSEFKGYWDRVESAEAELAKKSLDRPFLVQGRFRLNSDDSDKKAPDLRIKNEAMAVIDQFTELNWPDDFLLVFGKYDQEGCGGNQTFGFSAIPRKMFTLFAVLEPLTKDIELAKIEYNIDAQRHLRSTPNFSTSRDESIRPIIVRRGESLMIPQRIELKYSKTGGYPLTAILDARQGMKYYDAIQKLRTESFVLIEEDTKKVFFKKVRSSFGRPQSPAMHESYVFGNALQIASLRIDGNKTKIVPPPASSVLSVMGSAEASCPFMYFRRPDGELISFGRILVGAHSPSDEREQIINIAEKVKTIIIAEKEPEISIIKVLEVRDRLSGVNYRLAENLTIRPNRSIELSVPSEILGEFDIVIRGYYQPLFALR